MTSEVLPCLLMCGAGGPVRGSRREARDQPAAFWKVYSQQDSRETRVGALCFHTVLVQTVPWCSAAERCVDPWLLRYLTLTWAFLVAQLVKNPPAVQETWL